MQGEKTKLYMRTRPPDSSAGFYPRSARQPVGLWMRGVESLGFINGEPVVMVRLQDGAFEPLADLLVTEITERRQVTRPEFA